MLNLTGKLLIAMPGMGDPRFEHSVVLMCSHDENGGMGLIINKSSGDVMLSDLMQQMEIPTGTGFRDAAVRFGGPVEMSRGFVLHTTDYTSNLHSLEIGDGFKMTATLDVLEDMAEGKGPDQAMMVLGYSGWGAGQLEAEIVANGWLTADGDPDLVFGLPDCDKWAAALAQLGVEPLSLSASAGHA